jgi:starch phosphorylase
VVFLPNFNVSNAQRIYPAADLSEQISTAGKEASGTGNMKFMMNGALTIGTLDGANIEIREAVGEDNFFLFGLDDAGGGGGSAPTATARPPISPRCRTARGARPDRLAGTSRTATPTLFRPLLDNLLEHDPYLVLADYRLLRECQDRVGDVAYRRPDRWTRMSILNAARSGLSPRTGPSASTATRSGILQ